MSRPLKAAEHPLTAAGHCRKAANRPLRAVNEPLRAGQACIRGLRIPVATVVRCVASGMSSDEILEAYPDLEQEDIAEALQYAASLTGDRIIPLAQTGS